MTWCTKILNELLTQTSLFQTSRHRNMARAVTLPDVKRQANKIGPHDLRSGMLVFFAYEASTVKWWDKFPCCLVLVPPTIQDPEHFIGANFHYLPVAMRLMLLIYFLTLQNINTPKKRLSIETATALVRMLVQRYPTSVALYHKYKVENLQSPCIVVPNTEYLFALCLPVESFTIPLSQVYYHSLRRASS